MTDPLNDAWKEFRELFIAAHHNPIARRQQNDPYQIACREAFDKLDKAMKGRQPGPDDLQKGLSLLRSLNAPSGHSWVGKALDSGMMIDADTPEGQKALVGNRPALDIKPDVG